MVFKANRSAGAVHIFFYHKDRKDTKNADRVPGSTGGPWLSLAFFTTEYTEGTER